MDDNNIEKENDQLNEFVDGALNKEERVNLLSRIDDEGELRDELYNLHHIKELVQFSYPLKSENASVKSKNSGFLGSMVASLLFVLCFGFLGGYLTFSQKLGLSNQQEFNVADDGAVQLTSELHQKQKIMIYLGSSLESKIDETLDKAESILTKYDKAGAEVLIVASAGGVDLLRSSNSKSKNRIKKMSGLYEGLRFIACNSQIYHLHEQGEPVHLVNEAEVAPSAVKFVVEHLQKGWKFIAI